MSYWDLSDKEMKLNERREEYYIKTGVKKPPVINSGDINEDVRIFINQILDDQKFHEWLNKEHKEVVMYFPYEQSFAILPTHMLREAEQEPLEHG